MYKEVVTIQKRKYPETKKQILLLKGAVSTDEIADPEADVKFVFGAEWENSSMLYYINVKKVVSSEL